MRKNSSKSFGYLFFLIFLGLALWAFIKNQNVNYWFIGIGILFLLLTLTKSKLLNPLNNIWNKFGKLLGRIVAPIIISMIFFLIVTPIGLILKMFHKDLLNLKFNNNKTYWMKKDKTIQSMNKQF
ncbi:SxtJ family membrane protein [Pelagibacteraceae bacterium]|nr:SxtJ family membrane protein [Pelagibacteraceae bacterium]